MSASSGSDNATREPISSKSIERFVFLVDNVSKHLKISLASRQSACFSTTLSMNRFSLSSFTVLDGCVSLPSNERVNVKLIQLTTSPKLGFPPRLGNVLTKDEWNDSQRLFVLSEIRCERHVPAGTFQTKMFCRSTATEVRDHMQPFSLPGDARRR